MKQTRRREEAAHNDDLDKGTFLVLLSPSEPMPHLAVEDAQDDEIKDEPTGVSESRRSYSKDLPGDEWSDRPSDIIQKDAPYTLLLEHRYLLRRELDASWRTAHTDSREMMARVDI